MIFRVRYQTIPFAPHVYCALFAGRDPDQTFVLLGTFTVRAGEEFEALRDAFSKAEFVDSSPTVVPRRV